MAPRIRKARIKDVKPIRQLVMDASSKGQMLPRSYNDLYSRLRDFFVAVDENDGLVGCCALSICWEDLAEVRSLAVLPEHRKKGTGGLLVEACLSEALTLGIYTVFTLTYRTDFFAKLGFETRDKSVLPQKIWSDCYNCPHFPDCHEVAMIIDL